MFDELVLSFYFHFFNHCYHYYCGRCLYRERYVERVEHRVQRSHDIEANKVPPDELSSKYVFQGSDDVDEDGMDGGDDSGDDDDDEN